MQNKIFYLSFLWLLTGPMNEISSRSNPNLTVSFRDKSGQIEIGGKYVGVEFHHSRPLPARISFYYPVANSIDLSTDYWQRGQSAPMSLTIKWADQTDSLTRMPCEYRYTPFHVTFHHSTEQYQVQIHYDFCEDLPVLVWQCRLKNPTQVPQQYEIHTSLSTSVRTCHTYALKNQAQVSYLPVYDGVLTHFDDTDTDSVILFMVNAGAKPLPDTAALNATSPMNAKPVLNPRSRFRYQKLLKPGEEMTIIQLIGTARPTENQAMIQKAIHTWPQEVTKNHHRVENYVFGQAHLHYPDSALQQTANWAKAILASNQHYLAGKIVPMPCPAEYNFFFTHDALLTSLGAVLFDPDWVKSVYLFLNTLTQPDSILPHAYYWRDDGFKTEFCHRDNWNHLWFIILTSSYLKHSADTSTVKLIYPTLRKSLRLMLTNKGTDDLMHASRPDWWDIGNVYGARAYLSILMIQALRDFVFIAQKLHENETTLLKYLNLADCLQKQLSQRLWDAGKGYLMNALDSVTTDSHFYTGSLLAAHFNVIDDHRKKQLLKSAEQHLLDPQIGIRNAMPADFHQLIDTYHFNGLEMGQPYYYFNAGVWPQGIVWYVLGLLAIHEPEAASAALKKYLTLDGITHSPNGQPSFFEYRNTDFHSPAYGQIDKPTFLWAAGWYLYALYHLAGVRENSWQIYLCTDLPANMNNFSYDLTLFGKRARIEWRNQGRYIRQMMIDQQPAYSLVLYSPCRKIVLERGEPLWPYLARTTCSIETVQYTATESRLSIQINGLPGQTIELVVISPTPLKQVTFNEVREPAATLIEKDGSVFHYLVKKILPEKRGCVHFQFYKRFFNKEK